MRDARLPTELRVDLATTVAPFVHGRPKHGGPSDSKLGGPPTDVNGEGAHSGTDIGSADAGTGPGVKNEGINSATEERVSDIKKMGVDGGPQKAVVNSITEKEGAAGIEKQGVALAKGGEAVEPLATAPAPEAILPMVTAPPTMPAPRSTADLSPVDYLLSVMNDPQAPARLRIKAARVAVLYVHAKVGQAALDEAAVDDAYGFTFELAVARALREDIIALQTVPSGSKDERRAIETRLFERQMMLAEPPPSYKGKDYTRDWNRLQELETAGKAERLSSKQAKAIEAEALILTARTRAYTASHQRPRLNCLGELMDKNNRVDLTFHERLELSVLFDSFWSVRNLLLNLMMPVGPPRKATA